MDSLLERLRSSEYTSLREEMLRNKSYVFERPLFIISAFAVAYAQLFGKEHVMLLPILLVIVLHINLLFTENRLRSNARIIAYIDVVHEPSGTDRWKGWEKSLRKYRIWMKNNGTSKLVLNRDAIPDSTMFYSNIFWLHIGFSLIFIFMSGLNAYYYSLNNRNFDSLCISREPYLYP